MALTTYQAEREGLVIGDGTDYDVVGITGSGMPEVEAIDVRRLDEDGSYPTRVETVGNRSWTISLWVLAQPGLDTDEKLTALKAAFAKGNVPLPFKFNWPLGFGLGTTGNDERRVEGYVRRRSGDLQEQENVGRFPVTIQLDCLDPRVYEEQLRMLTVIPAVTDVGRTYPRTYPLTYESAESGVGQAQNFGKVDTFPTARITGPITNPRIENITTDESLRFNIVIADGDFLEIDFLQKQVLLNGTADRYSTKVVASNFFAVEPGVNDIRLGSQTFSNGAQLTFRWRSAWL